MIDLRQLTNNNLKHEQLHVVTFVSQQVYRSVLLNNGRRVPSCSAPGPDSIPDLAGDSQPFGERSSADGEAEMGSDEVGARISRADVDSLLYRSEIPVGSRGDIIQFYNKVFIGYIKDFVTRFSPTEDVSYDTLVECPIQTYM